MSEISGASARRDLLIAWGIISLGVVFGFVLGVMVCLLWGVV